ncbi:hypothetical protein GGR53DRAFT_486298 [Hypoxylon sp. FL1150]|nr:hypothetical protein GGR53DRAFT_486298 [Hypoxylon sp. FL1150]
MTLGFFIEGTGFEDVAVLAISAFIEETDPLYLRKFQDVVQSFLSQSSATKKARRSSISLVTEAASFLLGLNSSRRLVDDFESAPRLP